MNDISNQNLRVLATRVSVVPPKPALTKEGNNMAASGGNSLPHAAKPFAKPKVQKQQMVDAAKTAGSVKDSHIKDSQIKESIEAAVARMNEYTQSMQRDLRFNLDDSSGRMVVIVIDRESKEVIRQIPDDVFLKMARNLKTHMEMTVEQRMGENDRSAVQLINTKA